MIGESGPIKGKVRVQNLITVSAGTARALSLIFPLLICYVAGIALVDENMVRTAAIGFGIVIVLFGTVGIAVAGCVGPRQSTALVD